jgi:hypothetical protein
MPEAPVNKDDGSPTGEDDVRTPRQIAPADPKTITHPVSSSPYDELS